MCSKRWVVVQETPPVGPSARTAAARPALSHDGRKPLFRRPGRPRKPAGTSSWHGVCLNAGSARRSSAPCFCRPARFRPVRRSKVLCLLPGLSWDTLPMVSCRIQNPAGRRRLLKTQKFMLPWTQPRKAAAASCRTETARRFRQDLRPGSRDRRRSTASRGFCLARFARLGAERVLGCDSTIVG